MEDSLCEVGSGQVGRFEFSVAVAEVSPETSARWAERSKRLAALLLDEWEDEQADPKSGPVPGRVCA